MADLVALAHLACETAKRAGAEIAEASCGRHESIGIDLEKGAVKNSDAHTGEELFVRCFHRGGMGAAHANALSEATVRETAEQAAALARGATPDPDFVSLPGPAEYVEVEGRFDEKVAGLGIAELMVVAVGEVEGAREVAPDVIVGGGVGRGFGEGALVNSLGVEVLGRWSSLGASISAVVKRGEDVGSFYEWNSARVLEDFAPQGIGAKATQIAVKMLGSRPVPTGTFPIVFGPLAATDLLHSLVQAANAESIQRQRSYLVGKKDEIVASECITLADQPLINRGLSSSPWDGEGFPHRTITIVEEGILRTYLHNSYTANKAKEPNTGHATVGGGIASTNVNPRLGSRPAQQLIAEVDEGLYVNMGGVSPNPVTGEISGVIDFGFKIENGELAYPVRKTMIGMSILELLANIDAVSSDYRAEPGRIMPTLRASAVRLAGAT